MRKYTIETFCFLALILIVLVVFGVKSGLLDKGKEGLAEKGRGLFPEEERIALEHCLEINFEITKTFVYAQGRDDEKEIVVGVKNRNEEKIDGFYFKVYTDEDEMFTFLAAGAREDGFVNAMDGEDQKNYQFRYDHVDNSGSQPLMPSFRGRTNPEEKAYIVDKIEVVPIISVPLPSKQITCPEMSKKIPRRDIKSV